jgi:O-antigen/teichoic acid export membrane protein
MMSLKSLAGQTAIYGLPSILGRFLNFLLVPLYTGQFVAAEYGIVNEVYAVVAFVAVILPLGFEPAYFRYAAREEYNEKEVYQSALAVVTLSALSFIFIILIFTQPVANWMLYPDHPEYILWMSGALFFDALAVIPLARLRHRQRAMKFAVINLTGILVNIGLNALLVWYFLGAAVNGNIPSWLQWLDTNIGVGFIFIANFISSGVRFLLLIPSYSDFRLKFNRRLNLQLLRYALPLVVAAFAGVINETIDRRLLRVILQPLFGAEEALAQVGIYGAVYKLSIILTLFTQAFRYAAEPFFFRTDEGSNKKTVYADMMKWYTIVALLASLLVLLFLDIFKILIRTEEYWTGLYILPILLMANIFLGWIYNLSVWYKVIHRTAFGGFIALAGAGITVLFNYALIPSMGYEGSAWATFTAYGFMAVLSYALSRRHYKISYDLPSIFGYMVLAILLVIVDRYWIQNQATLLYIWKLMAMVVFVSIVAIKERKTLLKLLR